MVELDDRFVGSWNQVGQEVDFCETMGKIFENHSQSGNFFHFQYLILLTVVMIRSIGEATHSPKKN
jgi:hypothetical protein